MISPIGNQLQMYPPLDTPRSFRMRLFGPPEIEVAGRPIERLRSQKGKWLLCLLALRADRALDRAHVAGVLWPDSSEELALASLRRTLTDLRRALGAEQRRILAPTPRALQLDTAAASIDVLEFDRGIASRNAAGLAEAVHTYSGPLLEGCCEEWADAERRAREQAYVEALAELAERALAVGSAGEAAEHLRRAVSVEPLSEPLQQSLMRALAAQGDYASVVAAYRKFRLRLHHDLQADPSRETLELYAQVRAEARRAGHASVARAAPQTAIERPIRALPRPLTEFIGRERELAEIPGILRDARLVTLVGPGGIGKTRLAIRIAEDTADEWTAGVCLVDLAPVRDGSMISSAISRTLGLEETSRESPDRRLAQWLRSRALLLVVDNCEHLAYACASLVSLLLAECPDLCLLATSRQPLGIAGERVWRMQPLTLPGLPASEEESEHALLLHCEAVRLFVARAAAAAAGFRLTPRTASAAVQICRRLDGIPLAIELAAARVKVMSVQQIAERLNDRFALLTSGSSCALPRQQTLRALIDWSYNLLTSPERVLLRRLAVFTGGFDLHAAEAVCSEPAQAASAAEQLARDDVLDALTGLVDKSLVSVDDTCFDPRFYLLESTRAYARDILQGSGEAASIQAAHSGYFFDLAVRGRKGLDGPEQTDWSDTLEREMDNIRTAMEYMVSARSTEEEIDRSLSIVANACVFWLRKSREIESRAWIGRTLADVTLRTAARADLELQAAALSNSAGNVEETLRHTRLAREISEQEGDAIGAARADLRLARLAMDSGDYDHAHAICSGALKAFTQNGDRCGQAQAWNSMAHASHRAGDLARTEELVRNSLRIWRQEEHLLGIAGALNNLGTVAYSRGEFMEARRLHQEVLEINRKLGTRAGQGWSLDNLAETWQAEGEYCKARELMAESLRVFHNIGAMHGVVDSLDGMAELSVALDPSPAGAERTARTFGATERLRAEMHFTRPPIDGPFHEEAVSRAGAILGPARYQAACIAGADLELAEIVRQALSTPG